MPLIFLHQIEIDVVMAEAGKGESILRQVKATFTRKIVLKRCGKEATHGHSNGYLVIVKVSESVAVAILPWGYLDAGRDSSRET